MTFISNRIEPTDLTMNILPKIYRLPLLILCLLLFTSTPLSAELNSLSKIEHIKQDDYRTFLKFYNQTTPNYEVFENLKSKVVIIKFRNTRLSKIASLIVLDNPLLSGLQVQKITDTEYWVKVKLKHADTMFNIRKVANQNSTLQVEFYRFNLKALQSDGTEIGKVLRELNPSSERLILYSNKPIQYEVVFNQKDPTQPVEIRMLNAQLKKGTIVPDTPTETIKSLTFKKQGVYLKLLIASHQYLLRFKARLLKDPYRLELIISEDKKTLLSDLKIKQEQEKKKDQEKHKDAEEWGKFLTTKFNEAERLYRFGRFQTSALMFKNIFNTAPDTDIGIRSNFRSADSLFQYQAVRQERDGDLQVIQAYKSAINSALSKKIGEDNVPHAYYNMGRSFLNLKFYEDAFNQFEILRELYPESPFSKAALFHQGIIHLNMYRYGKSTSALLAYIEENSNGPLIPAAYYKIGEAQFQQKRYIEAKESFDKAWSLDAAYMKKDAELMFHMGEAYFENGDFHVARSLYEQLIDLFPHEPFSNLVAIRIGDFLREEEKLEDAIKAYEKAINLYPKELSLIGKLRIANILSEKPDQESFQKAIEIYDFITSKHFLSAQFEEALLRKSLTLSLFNKYPEAISSMETFCKRFPNNIYVKNNIIQDRILETIRSYITDYYYQNKYLEALGVFEQYEKQYFTHPKGSACFNAPEDANMFDIVEKLAYKAPLFLIADSYFRLGLKERALQGLDLILKNEKDPLVSLVMINKGNIFDSEDKPEIAQQIFANFIYSYPEHIYTPVVKKALGDSYFRVQKPDRIDRAIRIYRQTIKDYQDSANMLDREIVPACWFALGNLYQGIGQYDNAIDAFKMVLNSYEHPLQDPDVEEYIVDTHFILGNLFYELNQIPEAFETYTNATSLFPKSDKTPWAKYQVGQIYVKNGNKDKALEIFSELVEEAKKEKDALWGPLAVESQKSILNDLKFDKYLKRTPSSKDEKK